MDDKGFHAVFSGRRGFSFRVLTRDVSASIPEFSSSKDPQLEIPSMLYQSRALLEIHSLEDPKTALTIEA